VSGAPEAAPVLRKFEGLRCQPLAHTQGCSSARSISTWGATRIHRDAVAPPLVASGRVEVRAAPVDAAGEQALRIVVQPAL
jgi:hypothetical protein